MRPHRGFTFVTFLLIVGVAAAVFWAIMYGPAYIERYEIHTIAREAANQCYREPEDEKIKDYIMVRLHQNFDEEVLDHGRMVRQLRFDLNRDDIRIERTQQPPEVNIWISYRRTVKVPFTGDVKEMEFFTHAYQDLSPVKW